MRQNSFLSGFGSRTHSPDHDQARQHLTAGLETEGMKHSKSKRSLALFSQKEAYWGINRFGLNDRFRLYYTDLFHTLLNMPRHRFIIVFFGTYTLQYIFFAMFYISQPDSCIQGVSHFSHALWFSVQTAATIGYGGLEPNPTCTATNLMVMVQVICSSLLDYAMLGVVFARFAAPNKRSRTIRFSTSAVMHCQENGLWRLMFRVANVRKHPILQPKVQLLLATPDDTSGLNFTFEELAIENETSQLVNLKLGLPVLVTHVVTPNSPLWGNSLEALTHREVELMVFLDGLDSQTSNSLQARHAYSISDIKMNECFSTVSLTSNHGRIGLDFSGFDTTTPVSMQADAHTLTIPATSPRPAPSSPGQPRLGIGDVHPQLLRSFTLRELTERTGQTGSEQDLSQNANINALCNAVLSDPVCAASLKRLALTVKAGQSDK